MASIRVTEVLAAVGCTSRASENAGAYFDDIAFQQAFHTLDPGDPAVFATQLRSFGAWAPRAQPALARRYATEAPEGAPIAVRSACEVSRALGPRLGLPEAAVLALTEVKERWDGLGAPDRLRGDRLSLAGRILHLAEQAVLAFRGRDRAASLAELRRRAGGHLDPDLVAVFAADPDAVWGVLDQPDLLTAVVSAEPGLPTVVRPEERDHVRRSMSVAVDLKGRYLLGHSAHVAEIAYAAGELTGLSAAERANLRAAALLHDLGRTAVSSSIWDHPGPVGPGDWERIRLHSYWTDRVLRRCPGLTDLAEIAAGHHERLDGSGYHRGVRLHDQSASARAPGPRSSPWSTGCCPDSAPPAGTSVPAGGGRFRMNY
ncbi:HD-GYP domain-containing protein [Nocardia tengchongensis]|uniref:HD-GYP domain-containing protein n=1 Tax=Nocardia tengchongensis TaxID=2055889 RepID=UPI00367AE0A0